MPCSGPALLLPHPPQPPGPLAPALSASLPGLMGEPPYLPKQAGGQRPDLRVTHPFPGLSPPRSCS